MWKWLKEKYLSYIIFGWGIISFLAYYLLYRYDVSIRLVEEAAVYLVLFLLLSGIAFVSKYVSQKFMKDGLVSRIVTFCYFHFSFFVVLPIFIFLATPRQSCVDTIMCVPSLGVLGAIFLFVIGILVVLIDMTGFLIRGSSLITADIKKSILRYVKDGLGWLSILISLLILLLIVINLAVVGIMYNTVLVQGSDNEIVRDYAMYEKEYSDIFFSKYGVLSIRGIASPERDNHTLITETAIRYNDPDICSVSYAEDACVKEVNSLNHT